MASLTPGKNAPEHDMVMTPPALARLIVEHFNPRGLCLDPCRGEGAFYDALLPLHSARTREWCEITQGRDFFQCNGGPTGTGYDWIITNPPWSKFRAFMLEALCWSNNVVFLATLTHFVTRRRLEDLYVLNVGLKEALLLATPKAPWPQSGFQLAAVHMERGYTGAMKFTRSWEK